MSVGKNGRSRGGARRWPALLLLSVTLRPVFAPAALESQETEASGALPPQYARISSPDSARVLIQEMKQDRRGPFLRLRWFCADGSVHPPQPYPCADRGGGHQHGELSPQARRLNEEEACASPEVDAVFICTPHAFHLDHARLAAEHGKPMLIEKPVTRSLAELTELERVVEQAGVTCMIAENYHFKPLARVLRKHLEAGDIGEPVFIELNRTGSTRTKGWRADPEMMGGGALLEGGVHWIHLVLGLGGRAREVIAAKPTTTTTTPHAPFEDSLEVLIKFENGSIGKLLHSWNTMNRIGGLPVSKIYGTHGNIMFESNGLWTLVLGRRKRFRIPGLRDIMGYRGMLRAFLACVGEGREPSMSLAVARRDMEVVFAAYRSLSSGRFEPTIPESAPEEALRRCPSAGSS